MREGEEEGEAAEDEEGGGEEGAHVEDEEEAKEDDGEEGSGSSFDELIGVLCFVVFRSVCNTMTCPKMASAWFRGSTLRWKISAHK